MRKSALVERLPRTYPRFRAPAAPVHHPSAARPPRQNSVGLLGNALGAAVLACHSPGGSAPASTRPEPPLEPHPGRDLDGYDGHGVLVVDYRLGELRERRAKLAPARAAAPTMPGLERIRAYFADLVSTLESDPAGARDGLASSFSTLRLVPTATA